jgi:hypothetical protein
LDKVWPTIRPDLRIKTSIEHGVPGSPMPAWSQANGGPLTDENINDIVAFIMSWEVPPAPAELAPTPTPAPSALRGPLGVIVTVVALLVLVLVGVIGALTRKR